MFRFVHLAILLMASIFLVRSCHGIPYAPGSPEQLEILAMHNAERANWTINNFYWDTQLADCASSWAEQCMAAPSDSVFRGNCQASSQFSFISEAGSISPAVGGGSIQTFVDAFVKTERELFFSSGGCTSAPYDDRYAHYILQIMWAGTQALGCGYSSCPNEGYDIFFCHYGPGAQRNQYVNPLAPLNSDNLGIGGDRCANGTFKFTGQVVQPPVCGDGTVDTGELCDEGTVVTPSCTPSFGQVTCLACTDQCLQVQNLVVNSGDILELTLEDDSPLTPIKKRLPIGERSEEQATAAPYILTGCAQVFGTARITLITPVPSGSYELLRSSEGCLQGAFSQHQIVVGYQDGENDEYTTGLAQVVGDSYFLTLTSVIVGPVVTGEEKSRTPLPANWWWWLCIALGIVVVAVVVVVVVIMVKKKKSKAYMYGAEGTDDTYSGHKSLTPSDSVQVSVSMGNEYVPPPPTRSVPAFDRPKSVAPNAMRLQQPFRSGAPKGRVLYDFNAQYPAELSARAGDVLDITEESNPDWYICKSSDGRTGAIPRSYLQKL